MTSETISLSLSPRDAVGKKVRGLRRGGLVPAVIHDHGKDSILGSAKYLELEKILHKAGKHHPVELKVGGKERLVLIKDIDVDPTKRTLRHVVFQAIKQDEKVTAEVPLHIMGEIPAERISLMVLKNIEHVEVEALPRDLPDSLKIDGSVLAEVGDRISVSDLKPPAGVTILTEPEQVIAMVEEQVEHKIEEPEPELPEGEEGEGEAPAEGEEGAEEGAEAPAEEGKEE